MKILTSLFLLGTVLPGSFALLEGESCTDGDKNDGTCIIPKDCTSIYRMYENYKLIKDFSTQRLASQDFFDQSKCGSVVKGNKQIPLVCCAKVKGELPESPNCGIEFGIRIVGGNVTKIQEHPWAALLLFRTASRNRTPAQLIPSCGGSLINSRYVLTAAHCIVQTAEQSLEKVRLGEWDTRTSPDVDRSEVIPVAAGPHLDVGIHELIPHESYSKTKKQHDIALIRLAQYVTFTNFIRPICLTTSNFIASSKTFTVAGWGITESKKPSDLKLKLEVTEFARDDCKEVVKLAPYANLKAGQICAGGERGKDSCNGDSGGPLMYWNEDDDSLPHWELVGLVSFGPSRCGTEGVPGVYAEVPHYNDWIKENVRK